MDIKDIDPLQLLETLQQGVVVHNVSTEILYANPKALEILRLTEQQALGKDALDPEWRFINSQHNLMPLQEYPVNQVLRLKQAVANIEVGICDSSTDDVTWVLCNAYPQFDEEGNIEEIVVGFIDISSRKKEIPFEAIVTHANDVILVTEANKLDGDGPRIVYVNDAFCELTGYSREEVIGETPRILQGDKTDPVVRRSIREALEAKEPIREKILNYSKSGSPYWLDMNIFPLENSIGEVTHFAAVERDITHQVGREKRLKDLASKDPLTGLLNRRGFFGRVKNHFANKADRRPTTVAVIDIDLFKKINDSFGHDCGDRALIYLASQLRLLLRESDLICRFGGEEFVAVLLNTDLKQGFKKLETFRNKIANTPLNLGDDQSITITVSIGLKQLDGDSTSIDAALNLADEALYSAKRTGRNKTVISD